MSFSEPSRSALRYAAAIADHFGARLTVLAVDDPMLGAAMAAVGVPSQASDTDRALRRFCTETIPTVGHADSHRLNERTVVMKGALVTDAG